MSRTYPLDEILLPMGGTTVKDPDKMDEIWESDEYVAEEKLDGSRYLCIGGRFFSRRKSVVDGIPVEKTENVLHLSGIFQGYDKLILDGEVYLPGGKSNEVTSIMGSYPERALQLQQERGFLCYVVYDILRDIEGNWLLDLPWKERRKKLEETYNRILNDMGGLKSSAKNFFKLTYPVYENKREFYRMVVSLGGEGVMLKNINGKYVPDKKPRWNWIKVKTEITSDVIITGFKPAKKEYEGKELDTWNYWEKDGVLFTASEILSGLSDVEKEFAYESYEYFKKLGYEPVTKYYFYGWIGSVEFAQFNDKGDLVNVGFCSGISEELRKDMTENPDKYVGQVMEISAMERTKDGYFRHPQYLRMRPDKNPNECIIGID
jgi:ATP-dependent DNA ligase